MKSEEEEQFDPQKSDRRVVLDDGRHAPVSLRVMGPLPEVGDLLQLRLRIPLIDALLQRVAVPQRTFAPRRAHHILLPRRHAPVIPEEVPAVLREVLPPKQLVAHRKLRGIKLAFVRLAAEVARAPARVNELPVAVVDAHGVPRVAGRVGRWRRLAVFDRLEAEALSVPSHHDALQAGALGDGFVGAGVAFAYSFAGEDCLGCSSSGGTPGEEARHVVVDVVVAPGKYRASLVCR